MRKALLISFGIVSIWTTQCDAWWPPGHGILTRAALLALPDEVPVFLRSGKGTAVHAVYDPDVLRGVELPNRRTHIRNADRPEHYINLEVLGGRELPPERYDYVKLCADLDVRPERTGLLPYALAEWTERLAAAFAEHRKWPEDEDIRNKCLLFAGYLGHFAQDACQPLHLTVDHHGRTQPDGSVVPGSIHARVDGMVQFLGRKPKELAAGQRIEPLENLFPSIVGQIGRGCALVDTLYNLHERFPGLVKVPGKSYEDLDPTWQRDPSVVKFIDSRAREATRFTAALYLTAWHLSAQMVLPEWFDLNQVDVD
jgi:hypothetical protein